MVNMCKCKQIYYKMEVLQNSELNNYFINNCLNLKNCSILFARLIHDCKKNNNELYCKKISDFFYKNCF